MAPVRYFSVNHVCSYSYFTGLEYLATCLIEVWLYGGISIIIEAMARLIRILCHILIIISTKHNNASIRMYGLASASVMMFFDGRHGCSYPARLKICWHAWRLCGFVVGIEGSIWKQEGYHIQHILPTKLCHPWPRIGGLASASTRYYILLRCIRFHI